MTAESSAIDVAPHWLMRLFGAQAATFTLGDKGLEVTTKSGENYLIEATSLANEATFREGVVFSRLVLQTDCGEKVFPGLRKADGEKLFHWLRAHWLRKLAPEIEQVVRKIRALLNKGYPRQSRLDAARVMAEQALQRFQRVPEPQWVSLVWEGLDWIRFEFRKVTVAKSPNPHRLVVLLQTRLPSVSIFSALGSAATLTAIS